MTSSLKKTSKVVKAWGGFVDGHLDMGWRLFGRDDITPLVSVFRTRKAARAVFADVRRVEIREAGPKRA